MGKALNMEEFLREAESLNVVLSPEELRQTRRDVPSDRVMSPGEMSHNLQAHQQHMMNHMAAMQNMAGVQTALGPNRGSRMANLNFVSPCPQYPNPRTLEIFNFKR